MSSSTAYEVVLQQATPRAIAAVRARVAASRVAAEFGGHLDQVYAAARAGRLRLDGQNIFVYRDVPDRPGTLDVEFGVGTESTFDRTGNVVYSLTPAGRVATATHRGDYGALGDAHAAIVRWCRAHDVVLAGPRWEVYGHWREGSVPRVDVFHLLAS